MERPRPAAIELDEAEARAALIGISSQDGTPLGGVGTGAKQQWSEPVMFKRTAAMAVPERPVESAVMAEARAVLMGISSQNSSPTDGGAQWGPQAEESEAKQPGTPGLPTPSREDRDRVREELLAVNRRAEGEVR